MKKYKIVIVDDHDILRDGLKFTFAQIDFAEVIGEASNGKDFLKTFSQKPISNSMSRCL